MGAFNQHIAAKLPLCQIAAVKDTESPARQIVAHTHTDSPLFAWQPFLKNAGILMVIISINAIGGGDKIRFLYLPEWIVFIGDFVWRIIPALGEFSPLKLML